MGCVYCATNTINGKKYIGMTTYPLRERIVQHAGSSFSIKRITRKSIFHHAIKKYGLDNFKWETLFEDKDIMKLISIEQNYISILDTINPLGYNLSKGGRAPSGTTFKRTEEYWNKVKASRRANNELLGKMLGVTHHNEWNQWVVSIRINGKKKYIGHYNTMKEAGLAYNKKAKELLGESAILNKIGE